MKEQTKENYLKPLQEFIETESAEICAGSARPQTQKFDVEEW